MAKETKKVNAYGGVNETLDIYGAFGWKLLSQSGTYGLNLELYRDTEIPHYEELVKAEALYEAKKKEYSNLPRPVKPEEPKFFDFKGRKEYPQKLKEYFYADTVFSDTQRRLWNEMKQIVNDCKLNYILD